MTEIKPSSQKSQYTIALPSPSPGTDRHIKVLTYGDSNAEPKIYIQTALHADEIPGMVMVHHLQRHLDKAAEDGKMLGQVILVPVANPIGMSQRIQGNVSGRIDLNNGKNYNRAFPDLLTGTSARIEGKLTDDVTINTSVIRQALAEEINSLPDLSDGDAYRKVLLSLCSDADFCIDIHCDNEAILYLYTGGTHPTEEQELCSILGCDLHLVDSKTTQCFDGSTSLLWLRLASANPNYPIIPSCLGSTLELRGMTDVADEFGSLDARNLFQFLINQNIVEGDHVVTSKRCPATPLESQIYVESPKSGVLLLNCKPGEKVKEGDLVAEVMDPLLDPDFARTPIYAPIDGLIMSNTDERLVSSGQKLMAIVGNRILKERVGTHLLSD